MIRTSPHIFLRSLVAAVAILSVSTASAAQIADSGAAAPFLRGADISWADEHADRGAVWTDGSGRSANLLQLLKSRGVNAVRLRAWVNPPGGYCGTSRTIAMGREVKNAGMMLLLDLHYSDGWADPGKQHIPEAWKPLSFDELETRVRMYTKNLVAQMTAQGAKPDMIQIGNEITNGMLWDEGRIGGAFDTPEQWNKFSKLLKAGVRGAREAGAAEIIIHCDRGADLSACSRFYGRLVSHGVDFDVIGLSYYPWWHGSLENLSGNMRGLAERFGKRIILVETAYPWTLGWNDTTHNMVGESRQLLAGYPASPEGQAEFLRELRRRIDLVPSGLGAGIFYWEPAALSLPALGSPWENLSLFDFNGRELPGLNALGGR